jgi:hypothetical protein
MTGISNTIVSAGDAQREHERIALAALTAHIFERSLDVPHTITVDRYGLNARTVMLSVHQESAEAWVASIAVDADTTKPVHNTDLFGKPMVRRTVAGRLPDLGIRVAVRFFEPAPQVVAPSLQVVPS